MWIHVNSVTSTLYHIMIFFSFLNLENVSEMDLVRLIFCIRSTDQPNRLIKFKVPKKDKLVRQHRILWLLLTTYVIEIQESNLQPTMATIERTVEKHPDRWVGRSTT